MNTTTTEKSQAASLPFLNSRMGRLLAVTIQLGLVMLLVRAYGIEESVGFGRLAPIIFFGFVVHSLAPIRYRRPIFLLLSLIAIEAIFPFPNSAFIVGIGLGLIGIAHLPIKFYLRVTLLVLVGVFLALIRSAVIITPVETMGNIILPIIGSMFMFRLMIYMYDLKHEKKKVPVWDRLTYFFLLPNVCFPLFPVVDFQVYKRSFYNDDESKIYQKGVLWIFRGLTHLLLYRLVYLHLVPNPGDVTGLFSVLLFFLTTYLLYLRISGQFHIIIGVLCLFGYNLPETHHLYYLADSFNDYWRRINIYWKDFMTKILFYPIFVKFRKFGVVPGLIYTTLIVFIGTWALHSYQWYWLQGTFPITVPDIIFWGTIGLFVAINSVYEAKIKTKGVKKSEGFTWLGGIRYSFRVLGMFTFITLIWAMWSSETVADFMGHVSTAFADDLQAWGLFGLIILGIIALGTLAQYLTHKGWELTIVGSYPSFARSAVYTFFASCVLLAVNQPEVAQLAGPKTASIVESLVGDRFNERDEELMARGYYEGLLAADKYTSGLAQIQSRKPRNWKPIMETDAVRQTNDMLVYELVPSLDDRFKNEVFKTNSFGMRDVEYTLSKPDSVFRIAFLGASYEMGAGVAQSETYDAVVEARFNSEVLSGSNRLEILNFAVGGYGILHNVVLAEQRIWDFDPDVMFFAIHSTEHIRVVTHLVQLVRRNIEIRYPEIQAIVDRSGVNAEMPPAQVRTALQPFADELIEWSIQKMSEFARARGAEPVMVYVPITEEHEGVEAERFNTLTQLGKKHQWTIISLDGALSGYAFEDIRLAPWDTHLSTLGHKLMAERMFLEMRNRPTLYSREPTTTQITNLD
ncbi:MAG: hypothetical protein HKN43_14590 [Rhodothermales bacterium]|nr:hypothetical protein [Rhodothermales bacterium]